VRIDMALEHKTPDVIADEQLRAPVVLELALGVHHGPATDRD
jgi:hypothetical protein